MKYSELFEKPNYGKAQALGIYDIEKDRINYPKSKCLLNRQSKTHKKSKSIPLSQFGDEGLQAEFVNQQKSSQPSQTSADMMLKDYLNKLQQD